LGSYVLQWRWDNEQTPQVWTTCADIEVVKKATTVNNTALTVNNTALTVNNTASSAATTRHGSSGTMSAAVALSAVLAAMLMF